jgi:hypothetical protein
MIFLLYTLFHTQYLHKVIYVNFLSFFLMKKSKSMYKQCLCMICVSELSRTSLEFETNSFLNWSLGRLELTSSLFCLVRFSLFSTRNSTQEFNMIFFSIYSPFFIYTPMWNYLFYKSIKTHHCAWLSII